MCVLILGKMLSFRAILLGKHKKDDRFFPMAVSKHEKVLLSTQSCVPLHQQPLGVLWHFSHLSADGLSKNYNSIK